MQTFPQDTVYAFWIPRNSPSPRLKYAPLLHVLPPLCWAGCSVLTGVCRHTCVFQSVYHWLLPSAVHWLLSLCLCTQPAACCGQLACSSWKGVGSLGLHPVSGYKWRQLPLWFSLMFPFGPEITCSWCWCLTRNRILLKIAHFLVASVGLAFPVWWAGDPMRVSWVFDKNSATRGWRIHRSGALLAGRVLAKGPAAPPKFWESRKAGLEHLPPHPGLHPSLHLWNGPQISSFTACAIMRHMGKAVFLSLTEGPHVIQAALPFSSCSPGSPCGCLTRSAKVLSTFWDTDDTSCIQFPMVSLWSFTSEFMLCADAEAHVPQMAVQTSCVLWVLSSLWLNFASPPLSREQHPSSLMEEPSCSFIPASLPRSPFVPAPILTLFKLSTHSLIQLSLVTICVPGPLLQSMSRDGQSGPCLPRATAWHLGAKWAADCPTGDCSTNGQGSVETQGKVGLSLLEVKKATRDEVTPLGEFARPSQGRGKRACWQKE